MGGCLEAKIVSEYYSRVQSLPHTYTYILYVYITCVYYIFILHVYILWYYTNSVR